MNSPQENKSRTKNQPKEEVFRPDIPRTSGGHSRGYPGPKLRSGRSKSWKNKHLGADILDPKVRTSTTLRDFQKLRSEKLWAEFSFPNKVFQRLLTIKRAICPFMGASVAGDLGGPLSRNSHYGANGVGYPKDPSVLKSLRLQNT